MSSNIRWLLPDGVDEVLPPDALNLEFIRRRLLDLYGSWGYEYVIPPMIEFLESLLTGSGSDLDLKTFKVTDQISGRTLGIRADITPQVARMDAHSLNQTGYHAPLLCRYGPADKTGEYARVQSALKIGS
jgi:ATP phosphoribosyltransferase regulatory subunit